MRRYQSVTSLVVLLMLSSVLGLYLRGLQLVAQGDTCGRVCLSLSPWVPPSHSFVPHDPSDTSRRSRAQTHEHACARGHSMLAPPAPPPTWGFRHVFLGLVCPPAGLCLYYQGICTTKGLANLLLTGAQNSLKCQPGLART